MTNEEKILQILTAIQEDVSVLKGDVSVLMEDVSVLKEDVSVLKEDVSVLKEDVSDLKKKFAIMEAKVDRIDSKLESTSKNVIRMENDLGRKVRALYDAYTSMINVSTQILTDHVAMKGKIDKHDLAITFLGNPKISSARYIESEERAQNQEWLKMLEEQTNEALSWFKESWFKETDSKYANA